MAKTYREILKQFHESIRDVIVSRPDLSYAQIAKQFGVCELTVLTVAREVGVARVKTGPKPGWLKKQALPNA